MAGNNTAARGFERDEGDASGVIRVGSFASTRAPGVLFRRAEGTATTDSKHAAADGGLGREHFLDDLKPGTRLLHGQYIVQGFLNSGGFGVTYLARDSLDRTVVIKECFPVAFCRRSDTIVRARSRAQHAEFRAVVRLFMQEARNLARLTHPNIVGVHQVFEDNDTAYIAIDYIDGRDMLDIIEDDAVGLTPDEIAALLKKLLGAVGFIHERGMLHRDISPDNILISRKGEPILIDFGAAREQASKTSRLLSALRVVKDGYSPQEFYFSGSVQGPSSDLYALAATFHHLISGEAPPDSQRRLAAIAEELEDPYEPLAGRFPGYPPGFLEALDQAASVLPRDRIASAGEWLAMIEAGHGTASAALAQTVQTAPRADPTIAAAAVEPTDVTVQARPASRRRGLAASIVLGAGIVCAAIAGLVFLGPVLVAGAGAPEPSPDPAVLAAPLRELRSAEPPADASVATGSAGAGAATAAPRPAALPDQIASSRWEFALPFETRPQRVGASTVPVVARVLPSAAGLAVNDWLAVGVGIYAVNETWVSDQPSIERIVFDPPDAGGAGMGMASLLVRDGSGGPFQRVSLAVPGTRWVMLGNGAVLRSSPVDGLWRHEVASVPATAPGGLAAGDVLLAELSTGDRLAGPRGLEALLGRLARAGAPQAVFEVSRDGARVQAMLVLSGE